MPRENAPITALLAASLVGAYGLELAAGGEAFCHTHGFVPAHASLETALSSMWLHDPSSFLHVGGNLAFLVVFGIVVERAIGSLGLAALYVAAGLGGAFLHAVVDPRSTVPLVGCSGALFGVLAVAGALRPRLLGFVGCFAGIEIWHAFAGGSGGVSFACHLGGFAVGVIVAMGMRVAGSEALGVT